MKTKTTLVTLITIISLAVNSQAWTSSGSRSGSYSVTTPRGNTYSGSYNASYNRSGSYNGGGGGCYNGGGYHHGGGNCYRGGYGYGGGGYGYGGYYPYYGGGCAGGWYGTGLPNGVGWTLFGIVSALTLGIVPAPTMVTTVYAPSPSALPCTQQQVIINQQ